MGWGWRRSALLPAGSAVAAPAQAPTPQGVPLLWGRAPAPSFLSPTALGRGRPAAACPPPLSHGPATTAALSDSPCCWGGGDRWLPPAAPCPPACTSADAPAPPQPPLLRFVELFFLINLSAARPGSPVGVNDITDPLHGGPDRYPPPSPCLRLPPRCSPSARRADAHRPNTLPTSHPPGIQWGAQHPGAGLSPQPCLAAPCCLLCGAAGGCGAVGLWGTVGTALWGVGTAACSRKLVGSGVWSCNPDGGRPAQALPAAS